MAKISFIDLQMTGNFGDYSLYKRKDSDKWIMRRKGGFSAERLKNDPYLTANKRESIRFGGKSSAARMIRDAMLGVDHLADSRVHNSLFSRCSSIMELDLTLTKKEKQSIIFSNGRHLLQGFSLNRVNPFDSIISTPIEFSINRNLYSASVQLPPLTPRKNFISPWSFPFFRFVVSLGIIRDMVFNGTVYRPANMDTGENTVSIATDWATVKSEHPGMTLELALDNPELDSSSYLLLALGIEFGTQMSNGIEHVDKAGSGKILGLE